MRDVIVMTEKDVEFLRGLAEDPPEPTGTMKRALARYREKLASGELNTDATRKVVTPRE